MTMNLSETEAIDALKSGDKTAFDVLYAIHKRHVYSLCLRMVGERTLAEDLTQETFLLIFRKLNSFRGESAFSTWVHRITVNVVLMHMRQTRSRGPTVSLQEFETNDDGPQEETFGTPDRVLKQSIDRVALERAIAELPPGYRVVLVLHDIGGYEHEEIADLLGCSTGNTKSQLHKARLKLRRLLQSGTEPGVTVAKFAAPVRSKMQPPARPAWMRTTGNRAVTARLAAS